MTVDIPRIQATLDLLKQVSPEARLLHLKNMCENNGIWTVPEDPERYTPFLFEIVLFGLPAVASDASVLPHNWMRAAENVLSQRAQETAA